jgi:NAD(P)-dependent dehydrogenase (short-subunit alcohol dehydrogenase family)
MTDSSQDAPVALVTGASRGIGRCAALALARAGFDVAITARTLHEGDAREGHVVIPGSLEKTAAEVEALGRRALPVRMDLLERESVAAAVDSVVETWDRVDVLVNNAIYQGPGPMELVLDLSLETADTMLRADYLHQLLLVQRVLPGMLERGRGTIIDVISATAYLEPPAPAGSGGWGVGYAAAKAAFARIVPILHVEHGARGIRAFNVDPGFVINERMKALGADKVYTEANFRGIGPELPGEVIGWLASSAAGDEHRGQVVIAQKIAKQLGLLRG